MQKISRRNFLKSSGAGVAAGVAATTGALVTPSIVQAATGSATLPYEPKFIGKTGMLKAGTVSSFTYPDADSPCALLKIGEQAAGGVGPDGDIVAFSTLCTHMGCPVNYDSSSATFKCPCHFSQFDPEKGGQMVCGQATVDLPQIELRYDSVNDSVTAVGVNGLIYGRQANILG